MLGTEWLLRVTKIATVCPLADAAGSLVEVLIGTVISVFAVTLLRGAVAFATERLIGRAEIVAALTLTAAVVFMVVHTINSLRASGTIRAVFWKKWFLL